MSDSSIINALDQKSAITIHKLTNAWNHLQAILFNDGEMKIFLSLS